MIRAVLLGTTFPSLESIQLQVSHVPKPSLSSSDSCIVKVSAVGINSSDVGGTLGYFPNSKLPRIPGRDFAGTVEDGPSGWVGKRVWGSLNGIYSEGCHAEYIEIKVSHIAEIPSNLSMIEAAGMGVPLMTAYLGLFQTNSLNKGEKVLILGANGAVGLCAMQLARWKGGIPFGLVRSEERKENLKKYNFGLDDSNKDLFTYEEKEELKKKGPFKRVLNCLGNKEFKFLYEECLADGGSFITYSALPGQREITVDLFDMYRRELTVTGINSLYQANIGFGTTFKELKKGFEDGSLKALPIIPSSIFTLENVSDAYKAGRTKQHGDNRVVIKLD